MDRLYYEPPVEKMRRAWKSLLEENLKANACEAACLVAERMQGPEHVKELVKIADKQSIDPPSWSPISLASGEVGMALMYSYLGECFPGQRWNEFALKYLRIAAAGSQQGTLAQPGLFGGSSGMALTLALASGGGKRYHKALTHVHRGLAKQVLQRQWRRFEVDEGVASQDFDVVSGAAGILAYLVSTKQPEEIVQIAIEHLLTYLIWLGEPGQEVGKERWYIPAKLLPNEQHRQASPGGNFNCGLSHGISGPLAALALAWQAGYRYPGLRESIAYLAAWLIAHKVEASWGIDWPSWVPLEAATRISDWQSLPAARSAWCYGTPGISRSLWLAGQALDDAEIRTIAVHAIESALHRLELQRHIPSPSICHGMAGLLQICLRFAYECESELVKKQIPALVQGILDVFDPSFPLGFRDLDQGDAVDQPAWLTGAPGIAMVLLAATMDVLPTWDRVLAIA